MKAKENQPSVAEAKNKQKESEQRLRELSVDFALRNRPTEFLGSSGAVVTNRKGNAYDLMSEAKKIYGWLKNGK